MTEHEKMIEDLLYEHQRAVEGVFEYGETGGFYEALEAAKQDIRNAISSTYVTIPPGYVCMPASASPQIVSAMASSRSCDDEGQFPPMLDLLDFSGENKARTVLKAAYAAAIAVVVSPTKVKA